MMEHLRKYREKISIMDIGGVLLGAFILAVAIQAVIVPAHLLTGGITGVALIIHFLTSLEVWKVYVALNIPVFIAGYKYISRRFAVYSLLGMLALTLFLDITKNWNFHINDVLLAAILGGILSGIGTGMNLRCNGSTGGLDIIAAIVKRYRGYSFGETFLVFNLIIIGIFTVTASAELAMFSAISIFVGSKTVDTVVAGLSTSKTVMIISEHGEEIASELMQEVHRGCTLLDGKGAYTGEEKNIVMVTVGKTQLPKLKEIIFQIDPRAFLTISESTEVYGKGFKSSRAEF